MLVFASVNHSDISERLSDLVKPARCLSGFRAARARSISVIRVVRLRHLLGKIKLREVSLLVTLHTGRLNTVLWNQPQSAWESSFVLIDHMILSISNT